MNLEYKSGSIIIRSQPGYIELPDTWKWDQRTQYYRTTANQYRESLLYFDNNKLEIDDKARDYQAIDLALSSNIEPRHHQSKALDAWIKNNMRGTICLPTGAGKSILAMMVMAYTKRPTLVVVPTIDLMLQWQKSINECLGVDAGGIGGGEHEIKDVTVATYDSAAIHCEKLGNKFGLLVFDECHHLPAPGYQKIAITSIAPFRLGLSATVERADQQETLVYELVGPLVYEASVHEMVDVHLAPYKVVTIEVPLSDDEKAKYNETRNIYLNFLRQNGIRMSSPQGWSQFIRFSARSQKGREAMQAYQMQKKLAQAANGKLHYLWEILKKHIGERVIIFTDNNAFAYHIGKTFLLPVLTHHTKAKERKRLLESFKKGDITALVTSKVLNEGVDVPEASVAVIMSGSGTVREHVQRLGRVLRHKEGKTATLYELIAKDSSEKYVNQRRRQHHAYKGQTQVSQAKL